MSGTDPLGLGLTEIASFDIGRYVECDGCGADLTDDARTGGFVLQSSAYGPCCAGRVMASVRTYGEEQYIRGECTPGMAFADWIREFRAQRPRGNEIRIYGSKP
jgi:hypothetical protein